MTTQEKNAVLKEFMGGEHPVKTGSRFTLTEYLEHGLYHDSAEWLIPVWYKFRDLDMEDASYVYTRSIVSEALAWGTFSDFYDSLVNAVQWYNSIQKQTK